MMISVKQLSIFLSISLVLLSCIDPVNFDNNKKSFVLVVEGGISTQMKEHYVKLTRTAKYGNVFAGEIENELYANIYVKDDLGNLYPYSEVGKGQYKSEAFAGEIGRSYAIFIETKDGKEYGSAPELITEVPEIDSAFYEFATVPDEDDNNGYKNGVNVKVRFKDTPDVNNYYKWNSRGTFKFKSNPELYTPTRSPVPVPKDCCSICWLSEENYFVSILDDRLFKGNDYVHTIIFLEDDGRRFFEKYYIDIEQKSLTTAAFKFYSLLKTQSEINGDIFDAPPAEITGNISSLSDADEIIIGHFAAYDVATTSIFIYGSDLPTREAPPIIADDCREVRNATTDQPWYW